MIAEVDEQETRARTVADLPHVRTERNGTGGREKRGRVVKVNRYHDWWLGFSRCTHGMFFF